MFLDPKNSTVITVSERVTPLFKESLYHLENETEEKITRKSIEPNYTRPTLYSFYKTVIRDVELNLALPKKELVDFIEKLSDNFNNERNSFKSIDDLFSTSTETEWENNDFKYRAKTIADMFYIYDYVTYILDDVKEYNMPWEEQLLDNTIDQHDKLEIEQNISLYTTGKTIVTSEEYGNALSKQLGNKSKKTIEDYYNTIHNLIENNAYKSLI